MNATETQAKPKDNTLWLLISSFLIMLVLGFIDEGAYNFQWMDNVGNWLALTVYMLMMFFGQAMFYHLIFKGIHNAARTLLSIILGSALGILFTVYFIFTRG